MLMKLKEAIGLGVAGNFTGHLEQAGEASDFVQVKVTDVNAPKGIFPFYLPGGGKHFLHTYPLSNNRIHYPGADANLQTEPEVGLICDLSYQGDQVCAIHPRLFGAYNDCSQRVAGASKISQKKNWGGDSKGLAPTLLEIDQFAQGGILDRYRITSFLERDGEFHAYGVDSPVSGYSYFYQQLIEWLLDKVNHQQDHGPLESIADHLRSAGQPKQALISVGATRYTEFGESHYLEPGDCSYVILYDGERYDAEQIEQRLRAGNLTGEGLSVLRQEVN